MARGTSLEAFSRRMIKRANKATENGAKLQRFVAVAVNEAVVSETPVDRGLAISNWILSLGTPSAFVREEPFAPGNFGSTADANILAQIDEALTQLKGHTENESIYITNNLDYIEQLNAGSSPQAEADFVRVAAAAAARAASSGKVTIL